MKVEGIVPAALTPFGRDGKVDLHRFEKHLQDLYAAGVNGVMVGGTAGEWYSLTVDEREALAEVAVEVSHNRGKTLVQVGCLYVQDAIRLANHAARIGADAVSSLPPFAARFHDTEIRNYFERVSSAAGLPSFIYYFPALTGGTYSDSFFTELRRLPLLSGCKFTHSNLFDLSALIESGWSVLNGYDPNLSSALMMGASGAIGAYHNVLPCEAVGIYKACISGDIRLADQLQREMNRVIRIVRKYRLIPALKFIMGMRNEHFGVMREPWLPLSKDEQRQIAKEMECRQQTC